MTRLARIPRVVPFFVLSIPARWRRRLAAALLAAIVLGSVYFFWLRDSSLVAIERVQVDGLTTRDAPKVRAALQSAARDMTTLHLSQEKLLDAAGPWPVVNDLRVTTDFPHGVRIQAIERRPVAFVGAGAARVPVADDGTVLRGLRHLPRLPQVDRRLVEVAGAAPPALLPRLKTIRRGDKGLVAQIDKGPDVILGSQARLRAKWAAATTVLSDSGSKGAEYVDVRLPERAVAGGLPEPAQDPQPQSQPGVETGQTLDPP